MQRIEADQLIPGRGAPVEDAVVVLDGPVISYAGPRADAPEPATGEAPAVRARTVLPGLWDCHTHLLGARPGNFDFAQFGQEHPATRAARSTQSLRRALDAGVTSIRELGGLGLYLAPVVGEGLIPGPSIYAAGSVLSVTGGHGDIHTFPVEWVHDTARMGAGFRLADGEAECAKAVREQLRRNARIIKVCASGGVLSVIDDPIHQQFTGRELRTIVEVAGLAERSVAAHCHGKPGIMAALEAGVLTIEHGSYLDDEACVEMRESGAILVRGGHRQRPGHPGPSGASLRASRGGLRRRCPGRRRRSSGRPVAARRPVPDHGRMAGRRPRQRLTARQRCWSAPYPRR
jgi:imidazolonepropionase-like amidohydrolase